MHHDGKVLESTFCHGDNRLLVLDSVGFKLPAFERDLALLRSTWIGGGND